MSNFDDATWVRAQLTARNRPVYKNDIEALTAPFAQHWAQKGGRKGLQLITADQVNKGQLMDMITML